MAIRLSHKRTRDLMARYRPLPVFQQLRYAILKKMKSGEDLISLIQGRKGARDDVVRSLLSGSHPYLVSEEGTGKTRLARSIAQLFPPVPRIAGCPYNDDPAWEKGRLCPRCGSVDDPAEEFGIEWVTGVERFSRIQGNEYTNEAKLLGLKDIQAIASGMSPGDPRTFTGTGVFRANRGLLFVDELPAIRTKVQVLLHPILEEQKTVLEEYGWEYPLDLCVVATGNPEGFSHVNEVPRPLIDRLETIYLGLPEEDVEMGIMIGDDSRQRDLPGRRDGNDITIDTITDEDLRQKTYAPWWVLTLINRAVRMSRACRWLERSSSIRGTMRAYDHACSTALMRNGMILSVEDAAAGLRLAMRGRVHLRQDLVEHDDPGETFRRVDELSGDLIRTALISMANDVAAGWGLNEAIGDARRILILPRRQWPGVIKAEAPALRAVIEKMEKAGSGNFPDDRKIYRLVREDDGVGGEYLFFCAEFIVNLLLASGLIPPPVRAEFYIPREVSWAKGLQ